MKFRTVSFALAGTLLFAQFSHGTLEGNLRAMECDTVLIAPKQKVVDPVRWSPDSKSIGIKLNGKWVRVDLDKLLLKRFKWRDNQDVAAPKGTKDFPPLADADRLTWIYGEEEGSRSITFWNGTKVEIVEELPTGSALRITLPDGRTTERWRTSLEDCAALSPSPDGQWVAFLCEIHGVAVMRVPVPARVPKSLEPVK